MAGTWGDATTTWGDTTTTWTGAVVGAVVRNWRWRFGRVQGRWRFGRTEGP